MASDRNNSVADPCAGVPPRHELIALLKEKYGVADEFDALGCPGLIRVVATFDFLSNNLPPKVRA